MPGSSLYRIVDCCTGVEVWVPTILRTGIVGTRTADLVEILRLRVGTGPPRRRAVLGSLANLAGPSDG
jgi:hypothetical protein